MSAADKTSNSACAKSDCSKRSCADSSSVCSTSVKCCKAPCSQESSDGDDACAADAACWEKVVVCTRTESPCPATQAPPADRVASDDPCWKVQIFCAESGRKSIRKSAAVGIANVESPASLTSSKPVLTAASRTFWMKAALVTVVVTFVASIVEGTLSLIYGSENVSVSLIGFGSDSWIEVISISMIAWKLIVEWDAKNIAAQIGWRERAISVVIGLLLCFLALAVIASSIYALVVHETPDSTVPSIIIAAVSLFCFSLLYAAKIIVATALNSSSIASDAQCTANCMKLSTALLVGSIIFNSESSVWWFDSATALVIALFIGRDGVEIFRNSLKEDFDGTCGCGNADEESVNQSALMKFIQRKLLQHGLVEYNPVKVNDGCCSTSACGGDKSCA